MKGDGADRTEPRIAEGGSPAGRWWTAFGSPELDATVSQALRDSPTLAEADATLAQARASVDSARGAAGPQVDANAGLQRERVNLTAYGLSLPGLTNPTFWLYSIGAGIGYDLDLFGANKRGLEDARARAEAQGRRADAAYLTLSAEVVTEAVEIASLRAQIAALKEAVSDDRDTVDITTRAIAAGGAAPSSQVGAATQLAQDSALLPPLQQQLSQARHHLALLVGRAPADWTAPDFDLAKLTPPMDVPVSLPSTLVRTRPDILAAEDDLHAATARIGVATAQLYPDVKLTAALSQQALSPEGLFQYADSGWNLGPTVTVPIFHGGALKAQQRAARAAADAAYARYRTVVLQAFVQVADVLDALAHDDDALKAQGQALDSATANLRDARLSFREGGGALLDMIDAQRQLNQVRRAYAAAQGQRYLDTARLFAATASDWRAVRADKAAPAR
jgi:NodT family efflux transporter outer membrane factor (OMF) lipoprotein